MISVNVNMHLVQNRHSQLIFMSGHLPAAMVAAVSDAVEEVREIVVDRVASAIDAPRAEINSRVATQEAARTSRIQVSGGVVLLPPRIPLKRFSPKQTASGVSYSPYKAGGSRNIRGAFGPDIPRLGGGVFKRVGKKRTPIKKQPGISLVGDKVAEKAAASVQADLDRVTKKHVDYHVNRMIEGIQSGKTLYGYAYIVRGDRRGVLFGGVARTSATRAARRR